MSNEYLSYTPLCREEKEAIDRGIRTMTTLAPGVKVTVEDSVSEVFLGYGSKDLDFEFTFIHDGVKRNGRFKLDGFVREELRGGCGDILKSLFLGALTALFDQIGGYDEDEKDS